jgi:hypothetical protein
VSVSCVARDGTAIPGFDFVPQYVSVVFGPGETNKTFSVPLLSDSIVEANETVALQMGDVVGGAVLGPRQTAQLIVQDNTVPAPTITGISRTNGVVTINASALFGATCVLQFATNLASWNSVLTNVASSGNVQFVHAPPAGAPTGFYRVQQQ